MTEPATTLDTQSYTMSTDSANNVNSLNPPEIVVGVILMIWSVVAYWKVFTKAKLPGWAAIVPIYNIYTVLKMAGRPGWWLVLYLIPLANIVVHAIVSVDIAKAFGKSTAFGIVGIWLFGLIGLSILAFGPATYKGAPKH